MGGLYDHITSEPPLGDRILGERAPLKSCLKQTNSNRSYDRIDQAAAEFQAQHFDQLVAAETLRQVDQRMAQQQMIPNHVKTLSQRRAEIAERREMKALARAASRSLSPEPPKRSESQLEAILAASKANKEAGKPVTPIGPSSDSIGFDKPRQERGSSPFSF